MKILFVIAIVISITAFFLVMRYNLHMFQLNGYKSIEHISWLKKNYKKQALLLINLVSVISLIITQNIVINVLTCLICLIECRYYYYLRCVNTKKKLVYTKRVKRQIFTNILINVLISLAILKCVDFDKLLGILAILIFLQPVLLLVVNAINKPVEKAINNYYVNDAKKKLKEVPGLLIIGVTGSYGKTSVKYYLYTLLQEKFNVLITPESYNTPMGIVKTIRESLKSTHEIFICEMGARHTGDIKEICDIVQPKHGIITSIGPQHLETFFYMENIVKTKFELADALPTEGMLFLNGDNLNIIGNSEKYSNKIFYRMQSDGIGYYAEDIKLSQQGTEFTAISPSGEKERFQTRLVGEHNVINVLGAIAVANSLGIGFSDLRVPVRRLQPVEHRMQMIKRGNITIIDDSYNSNPVGSKAAVDTLAMLEGVRILITPGMVELGKEEEEFNYKFGAYAAETCDYILLVGKKHTASIEQGILDNGFPKERCTVYSTINDALAFAYGIKEEGQKFILLENDLPDNY